jgi:hypothetical protein
VRLDTVLPVKPPPGGTGWRSTPAISPSSAYGSFGVRPQSGACGEGLLVALSPGQWAPRLWSAPFWDGGSPFPCGFLLRGGYLEVSPGPGTGTPTWVPHVAKPKRGHLRGHLRRA